MKAYWILQCCS